MTVGKINKEIIFKWCRERKDILMWSVFLFLFFFKKNSLLSKIEK
jgi:hypothetical protein